MMCIRRANGVSTEIGIPSYIFINANVKGRTRVVGNGKRMQASISLQLAEILVDEFWGISCGRNGNY